FIPADAFFNENPPRLTLESVAVGVNYVLILNTNAGLWGYNIGDTVKFVSTDPYRIVVTGRIKHFTSAFGDHVIAEEVDSGMRHALEAHGGEVAEFHVAPQVNPENDALPYHEWLIEFHREPADLEAFRQHLDTFMRQKNSYYDDLVAGNILQPLKITALPKDRFVAFMKSRGKLGGQNKVPRLANDRSVADGLLSAGS
ncbi:MAG: GH3 auxin-responsive promoter family protein, partial [Bacteroidota bacterium]